MHTSIWRFGVWSVYFLGGCPKTSSYKFLMWKFYSIILATTSPIWTLTLTPTPTIGKIWNGMSRHITLICPTSFIASISLSWSSINADAIAEITTSTCFNAARMLSWSPTSPCKMVFRVGEEDMWQMQGLPSETKMESCNVWSSSQWKQMNTRIIDGLTYMQDGDASCCKGVKQRLPCRIGSCSCVWSNQNKSGMSQSCTCLSNKLPNVSSCSNHQNPALPHVG